MGDALTPELIQLGVTDELRHRVSRLLDLILDEIEQDIRFSPPAIRQGYLKSALPALLRELRDEQTDDSLLDLRRKQDELMAEVRSGTKGYHSLAEPEPDATGLREDTPPDGVIVRTSKPKAAKTGGSQ